MKVHYFQRYHGKENVATANTILLLSRLYTFSPDKFFRFLKSEFFSDIFEPEIIFNLQEKSEKSVLDATITQESFKIIVETKLTDWFYQKQLMNHLKSFKEEKYKVLLTLSSEEMAKDKKAELENQLREYNKKQNTSIMHLHTTFENLANAIQDVIDDRDYEMQEVLEDFLDYCYNDKLIPVDDAWKFMRMQLAGATFDFNIKNGIYFDKVERGFRAHNYLGLYKNKSVRAIGKISARITAIESDSGIKYNVEFGELTEERKQKIVAAMAQGDALGYELRTNEHRYFFVEKFYETDFKKITPKAPMGTRVFDLSQILGAEEIPEMEKLAEMLRNKSWS